MIRGVETRLDRFRERSGIVARMSDESTTETSPDPNAPRSVTVDGQTVWGHDLKSQLDAADRVDAKRAMKRKGFGIARVRMTPGDAV